MIPELIEEFMNPPADSIKLPWVEMLRKRIFEKCHAGMDNYYMHPPVYDFLKTIMRAGMAEEKRITEELAKDKEARERCEDVDKIHGVDCGCSTSGIVHSD